MRLRLVARWWRRLRTAWAGGSDWAGSSARVSTVVPGGMGPAEGGPPWGTGAAVSTGRHRRAGEAASEAAPAGAALRPDPPAGQGPFGSPVMADRARSGRAAARRRRGASPAAGLARAAVRARPAPQDTSDPAARPVTRRRGAAPDMRAPAGPARGEGAVGARVQGVAAQPGRLPWYEVAHARRVAAGQRDCGPLEAILHREWAQDQVPPPEAVRAIDRLAELPAIVAEKLAAGLEAIHVGAGGVPDLDHMMRLRGVPLPSGRATWDACAGAYGERKIVVGTRPSSAPDVMCHEVGHALDDLDGSGSHWQSDSQEFRALYERCLPLLVSEFHKQEGTLGRREFFADAFAAIASRQRLALVDMLGGDTRTALEVMLFFNVRYGI
jgi:hypothetical protein